MRKESLHHFSRRERQIMEIIYTRGRASAAEVLNAMPEPPSYSAVRAMLRLLEDKGHLTHEKEGRKYIFLPTVAPAKIRRSALKNLLHTFFNGSVENAVASLLDLNATELSQEELERLAKLIDEAKKEGDRS